VAKFLRKNLPEKKTTLLGNKVNYFISSKAIDALLDSKFASGSNAIFSDRQSVVDFMECMLIHKFFHRALKIIVRPDDKKKKKLKSDAEVESSAAEDKKSDEKKGKKKVKLDMHLQQTFVDDNEPYVWIYEPISLKSWLIGMALLVGVVCICLFPLWPRIVRTYVYYLSIAAAGFLFFIIGLAVLRFIVFCIVWGLTMGKHHFWMLPNLTEDVGFWASFWPLYHYEYKGEDVEEKKPLLSNREDEEASNHSNEKNGSENGFEILDTQDVDHESHTSHVNS